MKAINKFLLWLAIPMITLLMGACQASVPTEKEISWEGETPNFIIWVADDQYLESVGCYGADPSHTPNIDRLAAEGLKFTRAYSTSSICTPARAALYTGMYPIKNGSHPNHSGLKADIPTMPGLMRELGYRSALVGKTGVHECPTRPTNTFIWDDEFPLTKESIEGTEWSEKAMGKHRKMNYDAIKEFMQPDSLPYCLFVASSLPHGPYLTQIENGLEGYPANNWVTDNQLGWYLDVIKETGEEENTVVIFVSDNGSNTDSSKYTLYDPGVHVPMIISWPNHVVPGTETDALADFTDVMPTLIDLVGGTPAPDMDGKSLVPLMKGKNLSVREDLYLSFTCLGVNDVYVPYPIRAVVNDQYKLIHYLNHEVDPPKGSNVGLAPEWGLYDLVNDPKEEVNLYGNEQYASIMEDMHNRLEAWNLEVGDKGMETEYEAVAMFPDKIGHLKMPGD